MTKPNCPLAGSVATRWSWILVLLSSVLAWTPLRAEPFALRGYYLTFMRMPVMGLPEWKAAIDCFAEDKANVVVLWTAGGFRSKKFPITWKYNEEHLNVRQDFLRDLIDYAHEKKIKILLGFTPFGYDGVNQFPLVQPEIKAQKPNGEAVDPFGIHCWGWNLCPGQSESQRLMRDYISEMLFDFYPNADGILVESSDYGVCHCPLCGPRFYDSEFAFVRWLSDEMWQRNPEALILVYPHYFTGKKIPGLDATAALQPFDPRWALFFTPHSAHFDDDLIRRASANVFSSASPVLGSPADIAKDALTARNRGVNGFIPSFESFSYVATKAEGGEPWIVGKRMNPFGLDPATTGKMPYDDLLPKLQRFAFQQFSQEPALAFEKFRQQLGEKFFGSHFAPATVDDLLELHRIWFFESNWYWQSPLLEPAFFRERATRLNWSAEKRAIYGKNLDQLRAIAARYADASQPLEQEMERLAKTIVTRWGDAAP